MEQFYNQPLIMLTNQQDKTVNLFYQKSIEFDWRIKR